MKRLFLFFLIALVYWRVFTVFFAVDDFGFLAVAGTPLRLPGGVEFFAGRYFSADALFRVCRTLFGTSADFFHLVSLGLHALNAELVFLVALRLLGDRRVAMTAAILFAVHPVAYTPAAWLAAGFNEFPVQTLALTSVWLLLSDLESPRLWKPLAMPLCVVIAVAFKQHAVLIPLYWIAVLTARVMAGDSSWRAATPRLLASLALLAPFYAFFWVSVMPRMRVLYAGPYERVLDPISMLATLAHLALAALNLLPIGRESLNVLVPGAGLRLATPVAMAGVLLLAAVACGVAWTTMRERSHRAWTLVALPLMATLLALPASMPNHVYEYDAYLSLPAVTMLWAIALVGAAGDRVMSLPRGVRLALVGVLVLALWAHGAHLHRTSDVVAQAGRARAIDRVVARLPDGAQVFVVSPSAAARLDTAFGRSVEALHGARGVRIVFADDEGAPAVFRSTPPWQLIAADTHLRHRSGGRAHDFEVSLVESAQWRQGRDSITLSVERRSIEQPFSGAGALSGIQITGDSLGLGTCRLDYRVEDRAQATPRAVGQGTIGCRDLAYGSFTTLPFATPSTTAVTPYVLRLAFVGDSGVVRLGAAPPEIGGLVYRVLQP